MKNQFMVQECNVFEREKFYEYIHKKYKFKDSFYDMKKMVKKTKYPFIVDFYEKSFWICNSITCIACAVQNKQIISINEFKKINE